MTKMQDIEDKQNEIMLSYIETNYVEVYDEAMSHYITKLDEAEE